MNNSVPFSLVQSVLIRYETLWNAVASSSIAFHSVPHETQWDAMAYPQSCRDLPKGENPPCDGDQIAPSYMRHGRSPHWTRRPEVLPIWRGSSWDFSARSGGRSFRPDWLNCRNFNRLTTGEFTHA